MLPAPAAPKGSVHPVSQVMDELAEIFADLGFAVATGSEAGVLLESRAPESVKEMTRAAERLHRLMGSGERWATRTPPR